MFRNKLLPTKPMSKTGETSLRAGEGVRTLDNDIGNVVLCQLSYARKVSSTVPQGFPVDNKGDYSKPFTARKGIIYFFTLFLLRTLDYSSYTEYAGRCDNKQNKASFLS